MPATTFHITSALATRILAVLAILTTVAKAQTPQLEGCYSSAVTASFESDGQYLYQSPGYCSNECSKKSAPVIALTKGNECWCGRMLPAATDKIDNSSCNTPCVGYPYQTCGGDGFFTVYSTGVSSADASAMGNSSSSSVAGTSSTEATATLTSSSSVPSGFANMTTGTESTIPSSTGGPASTSITPSTGGAAGHTEIVITGLGAIVIFAAVALGVHV